MSIGGEGVREIWCMPVVRAWTSRQQRFLNAHVEEALHAERQFMLVVCWQAHHASPCGSVASFVSRGDGVMTTATHYVDVMGVLQLIGITRTIK